MSHWKVEERFKVKIGGCTFINTPNLVKYGDELLFKCYRSISDSLLGIDFDIYDESGDKVATIRKGMIVDGDEDKYSIVEDFDHFTITEKFSGRIICEIRKREEAEGDVEFELFVKMYTKSGFLFEATPTRTNTLFITGVVFEDCKVGIQINPQEY